MSGNEAVEVSEVRNEESGQKAGLERGLAGGPARGLRGWLTGRWLGWLLDPLRRNPRPRPRLALLERIALAPRQSLALVEADGRRFVVATSGEGAPAFFPLDAPPRPATQSSLTTEERAQAELRARSHPLKVPASGRVRVRTARAAW